MDFTNLSTVLVWLAGAGGAFVAGSIASLLAENWPKWHTFPFAVKFLAPMFVSVLISVGATLLLNQTEFVEVASPWFAIISNSIIAYFGSQSAYMRAKKVGYGRGPDEDCEE